MFHGRREYSQRVILQWSAEAKILGYFVGETVGFRQSITDILTLSVAN